MQGLSDNRNKVIYEVHCVHKPFVCQNCITLCLNKQKSSYHNKTQSPPIIASPITATFSPICNALGQKIKTFR